MSMFLAFPLLLRLGFATAVVWLILHELHAIAAPELGQDVLFHRYAHLGVVFFAAISCLTAARRAANDRAAWTVIGFGILAWAGGEAWYSTVLWDDTAPPIPSPADVGYLLLVPLLLTGLALLLRGRAGSATPTLWIDGIIAALAVSALSASVVFEPLYRHV